MSQGIESSNIKHSTEKRVSDTGSAMIFEPDIANACLKECDRHRISEINRIQATVNIISNIGKPVIQDEKVLDGTFQFYLELLNQNEQDSRPDLGGDTACRERVAEVAAMKPRLDVAAQSIVRAKKRSRDVLESDSDFFDGKEASLNTGSWDNYKETQLPPQVRETRKRSLYYSRHFKRTKLSLLNSLRRPEFPELEWDNLLWNRPVNLDRVLIHALLHIEDPPILKFVNNHGTWLETWARTTEATVFLYPNRAEELNKHRSTISRLFLMGSDPAKVIVFDAAIRARVAKQGDLQLTDIGSFQDLVYSHLLSGYGVAEFRRRERETVGDVDEPRGKSGEICNRFNAGRCPFSEARCKHRHVFR